MGKDAFRYNALTSIDIPDSVTTIKGSAFNGNKLQSLVIPDSVTELEGGAFTLNEISELKLSSGLTVIPTTFGFNKLKYVEIPEGVTRIDEKAFSDNELVEVKLPNTLKYLSGFNNNEFRNITIPETVEELGPRAFASNKITSVTIPGNVKIIGKRAFNNTWHDQLLNSVIIEEGVEKIDDSAFANNQLKDVEIPRSLKELHSNGFFKNLGHDGLVHLFTPSYDNTNELQESKYHVINPANLIINYVFEGNVLKEETMFKNPSTDEYLHIGDKGIEIIPQYSDNQYEPSDINPISIDLDNKENTLAIPCKKKDIVEEVTIKSIGKVSSIAVNFGTAKDMVIDRLATKTFIIDSNNKEHEVELNWSLDNYNGEISGSYTAVGVFELPNGIIQSNPEIKLEVTTNIIVKEESEDIQDDVWTVEDFTYDATTITGFSEGGMEKLETNKDLILPKTNPQGENITHIGTTAFANKGLTSLIIPEGLNGLVIDAGAFRENQLNKVKIPEGVREILTYAFYKNNLKYVDFPGTLQKVGNQGFADNELISLTFPEGNEKLCLDSLSFHNNKLISITILMEVNKIHEEAFKSNEGYGNDNNKVHIFLSKVDPENNGLFQNSNYHRIIMLSVESIKEIQTIEVDYGTIKESIKLPATIELRLNNGDTEKVEVEWSNDDYNSEESGEYTFIGSYDLPKGMAGEKLEIKVEVIVKEKPDFEFSNGTITKYNGTAKDVVIPEMINGEVVTSIGKSVFAGKKLTSITIPDTVETIGKQAFANNLLTSVELPQNLVDIGPGAFLKNQITSIIIPEGVESIGLSAFANNQLQSVDIPDSVTFIDAYAFEKNKLKSIKISDNLKTISKYCFRENELSFVEIPNSVTNIDGSAFMNNRLSSVILHEGLTRIGEQAFTNNQLESLEIPQSLETFVWNAFLNNKGENGGINLNLSKTVEVEIGTSQENIIKKLNEDIKTRVTYMEYKDMKEIEYPTDFLECEIEGYDGSKAERYKAYATYKPFSEELVNPTSDANKTLKSIKIFVDLLVNEGIKEPELPTDTEEPEVPEEHGTWETIDFTYEGTSIIGFSESGEAKLETNKSLILPKTNESGEEITKIGAEAFKGKELISVVIPDTVTDIGDQAFNSNNIENLIIPDSVKNIGKGSFSNNSAMTSVKLSKNIEIIENGAFSLNNIQELDIPEGVKEISGAAFSTNKNLKKLTLPNTVTIIGNRAFWSHGLKSVTIPGSVKTIEKEAFYNGTLTSLILEEGIEFIDKSAFKTNRLEFVTIPRSIKTIGKGAFDKNENIKLIYSILIEAIERAEKAGIEGKSEDKVQTLQEAIKAAKELNEKPDATLEEVKTAVENINSAIETLSEAVEESSTDLEAVEESKTDSEAVEEPGTVSEEVEETETDSEAIEEVIDNPAA
ncbi:leucine-rich repeat protein [Tissierella praeacuta]|uniref:leucine-rich repeat protein n=1 Tax=Tissierella praeacuta TaxID=43131 RepID=UPI003340C93C